MDMVLKLGQMDLDMKVITKMERNMEKELIYGAMDLGMQVIGLIIK